MSLPRAFLSYAHADDEFLGGRIVALRNAIQKAVRFETGEPFEVFLDKDAENGIQLGQDWQNRLNEGLAEARFLIPILSPSYFASEPCRAELCKFLELELRAGRNDLLLPILIRGFARPAEGDQSDIARLKRIALQRQYGDWSAHIFEPFDQADGYQRLMALAGQIVLAINRTDVPPTVSEAEAARPKVDEDVGAGRKAEEAAASDRRRPEAAKPARMSALTTATGLLSGQVFRDIDAPWCPEMIVIPSGQFAMGMPIEEISEIINSEESFWSKLFKVFYKGDMWEDATEINDGSAYPQHRVVFSAAFLLSRYTVTFAEYDGFCDATGREKPRDEDWGRDRRPVINVSWEDATAYCAWLEERTGERYRLPSEAEWEYACRARTSTPFWLGETITTDLANYDGERSGTVPVDDPRFCDNAFGLYHMHGNVWEWCEDCWHDDYTGAPAVGSAWTSNCAEPCRRILRGGSWIDGPRTLRSASRLRLRPDFSNCGVGFRVARMLTP